jgi:tetratricopeptide (TPR) repeat protein
MTSPYGNQEPVSCAEVKSLFDRKLWEGSVSLEEQRLIDTHLKQCSLCRNIFRLTSALPILAAKTVEGRVDAALATVMEDVRRHREAKQSPKAGWMTFAIAGAIAALTVVGVWNLQSLFYTRSEQSSAQQSLSLQCAPMPPIETTSGVYMAYCDGDEPEVVIEDGAVRVLLQRGAVALWVDPERPVRKKVTVETAIGEVRVKGTLFKVSVDGDNAWVEVFRGIVEVIPKGKEDLALHVAAGYGAKLKQRATFKLLEPVKDTLIQALPITPFRAADDEQAKVFRAQNNSSKPLSPQDGDEIVAEDGHVDRSDLIEKEILNGIHDDPEPLVAASTKRLIGEARSCLLVRDWKCAASRYQEVLRLNSRRPGLTTVLITLAKIELRHLNRPQKALAHYKSYLRQAPNGPLEEEAFLGMADAYRSLGREDREVETLRRFMEKYPQSNLSGKARIRLDQLVDSSSL